MKEIGRSVMMSERKTTAAHVWDLHSVEKLLSELSNLTRAVDKVAQAIETFRPAQKVELDFDEADAFLWKGDPEELTPVHEVDRVDLDLLIGIEKQRDVLLENTRNFACGLPANNALLWGARGTGKSSLVKAIHAQVNSEFEQKIVLIEISRDDLSLLHGLLSRLKGLQRKFILFLDDLSFDHGEGEYKTLKAVLDGGIAGRPKNVLIYATSNRRHLLSREMIDNERATAINPGEAIEEKVSLSDRFGLWLGFHPTDQNKYLDIVQSYARFLRIPLSNEQITQEALEWALARGGRSGRTAWQFVQYKSAQTFHRLRDVPQHTAQNVNVDSGR